MLHHPSERHDISSIRILLSDAYVLLHEDEAHAAFSQAGDHRDDVFHNLRSQSGGRLIENQQIWFQQKSPSNCNHLLLAAAQKVHRRIEALSHEREEFQHLVENELNAGGLAVPPPLERELQVLAQRELAEEMPILQHHGDPDLGSAISWPPVDWLAIL